VLVLALTPCCKSGPLQVGDAAPDFGLPDSAGTTHHLSDFRGQVVALLGWTNS
jgi:peroxiredoxin